MASALINNASQIYFDSVFGMEDEGMVKMFKAHESSGLLRDNKVVSTVQGKSIEFTEEVFAGMFELPMEGLTDMGDVPKDLVFDARTAFSFDGQQLKTSCKKMEMNNEFRLLNDILAKTVMVKSGSFDAVTHERFMMMSAIHGGVNDQLGSTIVQYLQGYVQVLRCPSPMIKTWDWARVCTDIVQFHLFGHLDPFGTTNLCTDAVGPVVDRSGIPHMTVNNVQYSIQIVDSISIPSSDTVAVETVVDTEADPTVALDISQRSPDADLVSPSSYSDSPLHFTTDDIPLGDEPTVVLPLDLTAEVHIERLKAKFFAKISILETSLLTRADNQDRAARVQTEIFRKEIKAHKAALSEELDAFRKELSELVDYINRGGDAKKGEIKSSSRGPPPPDDQTRPGGGGGSRSEPSMKRGSGGSHSGGGRSRQRGFRYWLSGE
ncbi:hypothetical protein F511_38480 [Dorcoceras hygrometricum]|uniref:Uncharacterized protein n=1 Tax=Dorcoceras hygrometricum TaxID=472368 RepID=A0A2Z7AGP6_9LAMI|nr:hypothetical protein F511_38480 [Dorcoceras hygrometricum]